MSLIFSCSMFFLSFTPLWLSVVFIDIVSILTGKQYLWTEKISLCCIVICLAISECLLLRYLKTERPNGTKKYTVLSAKEEKTISVEFLLAYVMPLFAFDFTKWNQVILFLHIFLVLCWLCAKHKHFSNNVVLEVLGYSVYSCLLCSEDNKNLETKVISKSRMKLLVQKDVQVEFINNDFAINR